MDLYDIETGVVFWTIMVILGAIGVVIMVFFLLNLRNLLNQVSPQNRTMSPNHVWLNFIPIFSLAWMIITVIKVRDSVRAEFQTRGWQPTGDFGFGVGLAFAIMSIFAGGLLAIPWLVCFVMYWVKTAEIKNQLARSQPAAGWAAPAAPPPAPGQAPYQAPPPASSPPPAPLPPSAPPGTTAGATPGTTQGSEVVCPVCGAENRQNAKFCRSCGRSF